MSFHVTVLRNHQAALELLAATVEQHKAYVDAFGYPSGKICPNCGKEVFTNLAMLEQLAASAPGTGLAHDHCNEIATLRSALSESEKGRPIEVHITEMPKRDSGSHVGEQKESADAGS
jgi:hypothetical protein